MKSRCPDNFIFYDVQCKNSWYCGSLKLTIRLFWHEVTFPSSIKLINGNEYSLYKGSFVMSEQLVLLGVIYTENRNMYN